MVIHLSQLSLIEQIRSEPLIAIDTDTYPVSTRSNVTETGLSLTPNNKGEVFIQLFATDTNNRIGANDRLYDIKVYDQSGNVIPKNLYQIVKNTRWSNIGRTFDNSTSTFATFQHKRYAKANKVNAIEFKIIDGAKTVVPSSGTISRIDNDTIPEGALVTSLLEQLKASLLFLIQMFVVIQNSELAIDCLD